MISADVLLERTLVTKSFEYNCNCSLVYGHISWINRVMVSVVDSYPLVTNILFLLQKIIDATCSFCKFVFVKVGKISQMDLSALLLFSNFDTFKR